METLVGDTSPLVIGHRLFARPVIYLVRRGARGQRGSRHHVLGGWEVQVRGGGPAVIVMCWGLRGSDRAHAGSLPARLWARAGLASCTLRPRDRVDGHVWS